MQAQASTVTNQLQAKSLDAGARLRAAMAEGRRLAQSVHFASASPTGESMQYTRFASRAFCSERRTIS